MYRDVRKINYDKTITIKGFENILILICHGIKSKTARDVFFFVKNDSIDNICDGDNQSYQNNISDVKIKLVEQDKIEKIN
ncbi:MAG: hypothetical protein GY928_10395 [Colwellia sp.]|nr:hypothetical protein [Colwellia sp.]